MLKNNNIMKYLLVLVPIFIFACGSTSENASTTAPEKNDTTVQDNLTVTDTVSKFELDWRNFKIAVLEKDEPAVISFLKTEEIDAPSLIQMMNEDWIKSKLEITNYSDLTISEYNDVAVKEFRVDEEYTDEDGNTYESAAFFYFEEQKVGLRLIGVLMAG